MLVVFNSCDDSDSNAMIDTVVLMEHIFNPVLLSDHTLPLSHLKVSACMAALVNQLIYKVPISYML